MLNIEKYKDEIEKCFNYHTNGNKMHYHRYGEAMNEIQRVHTYNYELCKDMSLLEWLCSEAKEPILARGEYRYLKAVVDPFKIKVISIYKSDYDDTNEYIAINFYEVDGSTDITTLPSFTKGTMFKGMKVDKEYTLEDLDLC